MKRYVALVGGMVCFFLAAFLVAEALDIPLLRNPTPQLRGGGVAAAALGVGLLVVDVFLPVPSSVIMVMHGTMFGVPLGAGLSVLGSLLATALGFWIGRRGGGLVQRLVPPEDKARVDRILRRWGWLAIVITRPIPILAETTAILAGASPLSGRSMWLGAALGAGPPSLIYAAAGAFAPGLGSGLWSFAVVIVIAGLGWWFTRKQGHRLA